jgi:phage head maturation protease
MKREVRFAKSLEVRQQPGRPPLIRGYAARFNSLSRPMALDLRGGSFVEKIAPGAFRKAIAQDDVRALVICPSDNISDCHPSNEHATV